MSLEEYKGVFIFAQQVDNELSSIALELLGKAKNLAEDLDEKKVTAVLLGSDVKGLVDKLAEYGADRVIVVDDPALKGVEFYSKLSILLNILCCQHHVCSGLSVKRKISVSIWKFINKCKGSIYLLVKDKSGRVYTLLFNSLF